MGINTKDNVSTEHCGVIKGEIMQDLLAISQQSCKLKKGIAGDAPSDEEST